MDTENHLLTVENLKITFHGRTTSVNAVNGISFHLNSSETIAIVGESGSGKSVTALSLTRLLSKPPLCEVQGSIHYQNKDIYSLNPSELRQIRGKEIAYIFQDPSTSLNPVFTIGYQISEAIKLHFPHSNNTKEKVIQSLQQVGIRDAEERYDSYPHELSGGMQQRVMIAMALACEPKILIADEPTTALDVTIQKQIIDLLKDLKNQLGMAIILITHNFGIVQEFTDRVLVMFRGDIVEQGNTHQVLTHPKHPYTKALINCIPKLGEKKHRLTTIDHEMLFSQSHS